MRPLFGENVLPGEKAFNSLPRGSVVIGHSGLLHGRRSKPGGEGRSRYFVDVSYCQPGRRMFPAYGSGGNAGSGSPRVLAYDIAELAKRMGHDRDGRYAHLWDTSIFCASACMTASATVTFSKHFLQRACVCRPRMTCEITVYCLNALWPVFNATNIY